MDVSSADTGEEEVLLGLQCGGEHLTARESLIIKSGVIEEGSGEGFVKYELSGDFLFPFT